MKKTPRLVFRPENIAAARERILEEVIRLVFVLARVAPVVEIKQEIVGFEPQELALVFT